VRQHVVLVSSRIVGALSRIKLSDICAAFVKKLEERLNVRKDLGTRAADHTTQRQQLLKLCLGMRLACCSCAGWTTCRFCDAATLFVCFSTRHRLLCSTSLRIPAVIVRMHTVDALLLVCL
jgi:hypothetical protein